MLSPNKALLVLPTKVSSESKSLRWGDRAESDEGLPSPLPKSAPPRVDVSKKGQQIFRAETASEARVKIAPVTAKNELGSDVVAESCVLGDGVSADFVTAVALVAAANSPGFHAATENPSAFPSAVARSAGCSRQLFLDESGPLCSVAGSVSWQEEVLSTQESSPIARQDATV
jgi:hypothetical protein